MAELDMLTMRFLLEDNTTLDPQYVAAVKAEYTGVFYHRFILGEWCVAEGLIYPMFDKALHVKSLPHPKGEWYVSVDYGTLFQSTPLRKEGRQAVFISSAAELLP